MTILAGQPDTTERLGLPYILADQAQKHVTHNEALRVLDVLTQLAVTSSTVSAPPATPTDDARYIVPASATGNWAGQDDAVAAWAGTGWMFYPPRTGLIAFVLDSFTLVGFDGATWRPVTADALQNAASVGINATADTTNRLALAAPASLFTHEGAGHTLKINRASAGDTASVVFQTNWAGEAELGLAGGNAMTIKVSPDGTSWTTGLAIATTDGHVGIGTTQPATTLHVEGPVRLKVYPDSALPDPVALGAGTMICAVDGNGAHGLRVSDGTAWS